MSNPDDRNEYVMEAFDYYYADYFAEAEEKFGIAIAHNPGNAIAFRGYHMALAKQGKDTEARSAIQRSLEINPNDPESWFSLATFLDDRDSETSTALEAYHRGLELEPSEGKMWRNLAILYQKSGNSSKAEEVMRKVLEYWPDDTLHLRVLELVLQHQDRTHESEEIKARITFLEVEEKRRQEEFDRELSESVKDITGYDIDDLDDDDEEEIPEPVELDYITRMYEGESTEEEKKAEPSHNIIKKTTTKFPDISGMFDEDDDVEVFEGSLFGDDDED